MSTEQKPSAVSSTTLNFSLDPTPSNKQQTFQFDGPLDFFPGLEEAPHFELPLKRKLSAFEDFSGYIGSSDDRSAIYTPVDMSEPIPKLQLGETGRSQLKSAISAVLKKKPELRKTCNSIQKVKNASISQLLTMARICGIWDQAVRISETFTRRYPKLPRQREPTLHLQEIQAQLANSSMLHLNDNLTSQIKSDPTQDDNQQQQSNHHSLPNIL
jgi:hypothetical protein